ncbi:MAG: hypothetical protein ACYCVH_04820 [Ignavibacteriaceae bacterium]
MISAKEKDSGTKAESLIKKIASIVNVQNTACYTGEYYGYPFDYSDVMITKAREPAILLGETKYYYATVDNGKLTIHETKDPTPNPGLSNVTFDDPVAAQGSEKNPVYWEYKYPVYNGNIFTGMNTLPKGMIRLVGRYWEDGKIFKTALIAHYNRESSSINIELKKPKSLGNLHSGSKDVFNKPISIDSICITYGGLYGIPPQYIKGQIATEGVYVSGFGFAPSYRYEPFTKQFEGRKKGDPPDTWSTNPFYITANSMGTGDPVPDHENIQYINYPKSPIMVWYMVEQYSQLTNESSPGGVTLYGRRNSDGTMNFAKYGYTGVQKIYNAILKNFQGNKSIPSPDNITNVLTSTTSYLRDSWHGGLKNIIAQTRIAASYGLIQMTYALALLRKYKEDPHYPPELLNVNSILFPLSMNDQLIKLQNAIGNSPVGTSNWKYGYDESFKKIYQAWDPWMKGYADKIIYKSQAFLPQP